MIIGAFTLVAGMIMETLLYIIKIFKDDKNKKWKEKKSSLYNKR